MLLVLGRLLEHQGTAARGNKREHLGSQDRDNQVQHSKSDDNAPVPPHVSKGILELAREVSVAIHPVVPRPATGKRAPLILHLDTRALGHQHLGRALHLSPMKIVGQHRLKRVTNRRDVVQPSEPDLLAKHDGFGHNIPAVHDDEVERETSEPHRIINGWAQRRKHAVQRRQAVRGRKNQETVGKELARVAVEPRHEVDDQTEDDDLDQQQGEIHDGAREVDSRGAVKGISPVSAHHRSPADSLHQLRHLEPAKEDNTKKDGAASHKGARGVGG